MRQRKRGGRDDSNDRDSKKKRWTEQGILGKIRVTLTFKKEREQDTGFTVTSFPCFCVS